MNKVSSSTTIVYLFILFLSHWVPAAYAADISSNPAAVNLTPGTGALQHYLETRSGIENDHGINFNGAWLADVNDLFSGGIPQADRWTTNSLLLLDANIDTNHLPLWKDGLFDVQLLQFNGQSTNQQAGTVQGYNSLPGPPPLDRFELYQLWFRQALFDKRLIIRIGKVVPTFDFNNVIKPVPLKSDNIPAVTGLIYTPIFVNPSLLGVMPGYYNSAYGITVNFLPVKQWYLSLGAYDGNLAQGKQTGLTGPNFNGSYFYIGETGFSWLIGHSHLPGIIAFGAWRQAGLLQNSPTLFEQGASGYYMFGSQRLWYLHPDRDSSGVSAFYQYGINHSHVLPMTQYVGAGFTASGLIASRLEDSFGMGTAYSWLNRTIFSRQAELMFQAYYQAKIMNGVYLEPAISYIPTPGAIPHLNAAWAGTLRAVVLF
jgi:porin